MEKQFISEQELQQLHSLQDRQNKIIRELGLLEIEKLKLKQARLQLEDELEDFKEESQILMNFISQKYGDCSIDLDSGQIQ